MLAGVNAPARARIDNWVDYAVWRRVVYTASAPVLYRVAGAVDSPVSDLVCFGAVSQIPLLAVLDVCRTTGFDARLWIALLTCGRVLGRAERLIGMRICRRAEGDISGDAAQCISCVATHGVEIRVSTEVGVITSLHGSVQTTQRATRPTMKRIFDQVSGATNRATVSATVARTWLLSTATTRCTGCGRVATSATQEASRSIPHTIESMVSFQVLRQVSGQVLRPIPEEMRKRAPRSI